MRHLTLLLPLCVLVLQRKLKDDAKRREALSKSKPSAVTKKRDSDENIDVTAKASKKQRSSKSYSKVGALKSSSASSNAAPAATKSHPEPAIKKKDKKDSHRRKSTGSVRFDASVNKPVSSNVHALLLQAISTLHLLCDNTFDSCNITET